MNAKLRQENKISRKASSPASHRSGRRDFQGRLPVPRVRGADPHPGLGQRGRGTRARGKPSPCRCSAAERHQAETGMLSQRAAAALPSRASCSPCSDDILSPKSLFSPSLKASVLLRAGTVMLSTHSGEASAACRGGQPQSSRSQCNREQNPVKG